MLGLSWLKNNIFTGTKGDFEGYQILNHQDFNMEVSGFSPGLLNTSSQFLN